MPIPFTCPHCGTATTVADQFAGQTGPCGRCGKAITIPLPGGAVAPAPRAPVSQVGQAQVACPFCGEQMQRGEILGDRYALKWQPAEQPKVLGIWSTGHPIGQKNLLARGSVGGFRCARCQKIIVSG